MAEKSFLYQNRFLVFPFMSIIKARVGDECKNMKIDDGGRGPRETK